MEGNNMKQNYLNKYGEVVSKKFKDLGTSWTKINMYNCSSMTKEEKEFLERYGLQPTIFNVANLRELGHIHLTEHFVKVVLKNGAIDKRD
jgi:hypothetical protein